MPRLDAILDAALEGIGIQMDGLLSILSVNDWQAGMAQDLTAFHLAAYLTGRGYTDVRQLTDSERRDLARHIGDQIDYLNGWADELEREGVNPEREKAYRARAALYAGNIRASYSRGQAKKYGVDLPAHPGDGSTDCLGACKCMWELVEVPGGVDAYWRMGATEHHCGQCPERAQRWAPLRIRGGQIA